MPHKLQKWHPNLRKNAQQTSSENTFKTKHIFKHFRDTRTLDPLAQAQSDHVFPFLAPNTTNSSFWPHFGTPNPFKTNPERVQKPTQKRHSLIRKKTQKNLRNDSKMGAQDNVSLGCFAASFPYRPEDWKSLENGVAEPPNRLQNVNECTTAW